MRFASPLISIHFPVSYWYLGLIRQKQGDLEGAIDALKQGVQLSFERPLYLSALGHAFGRANRKRRCPGHSRQIDEVVGGPYVSPFDVARSHRNWRDRCRLRMARKSLHA